MDHDQAVESRAVERYLLRQMPAEERERFEEHYFSCISCADEVRTGARFDAYAREVLGSPAAPARVHGWRDWFRFPSLVPTLASIALAGVVIYQQANGGIESAQSVPVIALHTTTRGDSDVARIPAGGRFFTVYFDVPYDPAARSFECAVTDSAGKVATVTTVPAPGRAEPVNILFKRSDFPRGQYTITVRGNAQPVPLQLKFQIE